MNRIKLLAALAALPFATSANAENLYFACYYQDNMGIYPITQLFTLKGDAIADSYPTWSYNGIKEWEAQFADKPDRVRFTSDYTTRNIIGQYMKFAEEWGTHNQCWVTTSRERALAWFASMSAQNRVDQTRIQDWRPSNAGVLAVSDWSGRASATPAEELATSASSSAEAEANGDDEVQEAAAPAPTKGSRQQADAERAAARQRAHEAVVERNRLAQEKYEAELAEQQRKVAEFKRATEEVAQRKAEQQAAAERVLADFDKAKAAHEETLRQHNAELAKYNAEVASASGNPTQRIASKAGDEGVFQLNSGGPSQERAKESLMTTAARLRSGWTSDLYDVQCVDQTIPGGVPMWFCRGSYRQLRTPATSASRQ